MSSSLPYTMDFAVQHSALPDGLKTTNIVLSPVNGTTFSPSSVIQFDYYNRGLIDPTTIYLRYKYTLTSAANAEMIGTPVYQPFIRNETIIGSQVVETVNGYNQVCNLLTNLSTDVAAKYGLQSAYGYGSNIGLTPSMSLMDGRLMGLNEVGSFSGLLFGILSNSEKMIPAFACSSIRTQLTMDTLANMFTTNVVPTAFVISNVELCYTMVDAGQQYENYVRSLGPFEIKTQTVANTSIALAAGTAGSVSLPFNVRLASVKSAYVLFTGTTANSLNKTNDWYDPTSNNGELSINIGSQQFPQRPLSTLNNKNGILMALRNATGSIYDRNNTLSINTIEWNKQGNEATTFNEPAKFIFGINLERIHTPAMLTGISTENSIISVLLQTNTPTQQLHNVHLILAHDVFITVDPNTRQVNTKQ